MQRVSRYQPLLVVLHWLMALMIPIVALYWYVMRRRGPLQAA